MSFFSRPGGQVEDLAATGAVNAAAFGLTTLIELFDEDRAAIVELLGTAMTSLTRDVDALAAAATRTDYRTVVEAAHRIKGTSGTIGASGLIEIASRIEAAALRAPAAIGSGMLVELRTRLTTVRAEIASYARDDR